jgi:O-antigen ligase
MFEAPKNLFLGIYLLLNLTRQYKERNFFKLKNTDYIFTFLFASIFFSSFLAEFPGEQWHGFKSSLPLLAFGFLLARSNYTIKTLKYLFIFSIISFIPTVLFGFYELFWLHKFYFLKIHSLGHVNSSGIYTTLILSACVSISLLSDKLSKKLFFSGLAFLNYVALLFIQSRSAFAIFLIFTLSLIILFEKFRKELLISAFILLVFSYTTHTPVIEKHLNQQKMGSTLAERDMIWNVASEGIRSNLSFFGIGPNNYFLLNESFIKESLEARGAIYDSSHYKYTDLTHNIYLSFLIERGIVGLLALISLMIFWARSLFLTYTNKEELHSFFWSASFASFLSIFIVGFTHTTFVHESGLLALFFFGIHHIYLRYFSEKQI